MGGNIPDKEQRFNSIFANTRDKLYSFLSQYSKDSGFVEDIMQQCYMEVWLKMERWQDTEKLLPLLKKISRDLLVDAIRKKARLPQAWMEELEDMAALTAPPPDLTQASLHRLDTAIAKLPEKSRTIFLMHRELGMSYKDIAQRLSLSQSAIEKHMSKAIKLLRQELQKEDILLFCILFVLN